MYTVLIANVAPTPATCQYQYTSRICHGYHYLFIWV